MRKKPKAIYVCPHCDKHVSWKTFTDHKRLFFDANSKQWIKEMEMQQFRVTNTRHPGHHSDLCKEASTDSPPGSPTEPLSFVNYSRTETLSTNELDAPIEGINLCTHNI